MIFQLDHKQGRPFAAASPAARPLAVLAGWNNDRSRTV